MSGRIARARYVRIDGAGVKQARWAGFDFVVSQARRPAGGLDVGGSLSPTGRPPARRLR